MPKRPTTPSAAEGRRIWKQYIKDDAPSSRKRGIKVPANLDIDALYQRFINNEPFGSLVNASGIKRGKLRRLLVAHAGGKEKYSEVKPAKVTRTRKEKSEDGGVASGLDDGVPFINGAKASDGWTVERLWESRPVKIKEGGKEIGTAMARECTAIIYTSPDGERYIRAQHNERADLICVTETAGIPAMRLRRYETSALAKKAERSQEKHAETKERGEAALQRKTEERRKRKAAREAAKAAPKKKGRKS